MILENIEKKFNGVKLHKACCRNKNKPETFIISKYDKDHSGFNNFVPGKKSFRCLSVKPVSYSRKYNIGKPGRDRGWKISFRGKYG